MIKVLLLISTFIISDYSFSQINFFWGKRDLPESSVPSRNIPVYLYSIGGTYNQHDPGSITNWNKFLVNTGGPHSMDSLVYEDDGTNSGITIGVDDSDNSIPDNGSTYCSVPTDGFPQNAHETGIYMGSDDITITFSGLNNAKLYDYKHLATRVTSNHNNAVTSQAQTDGIANVQNNCSDAAILTNLVPSGGVITITLSLVSGGFRYFNACILVEKTP